MKTTIKLGAISFTGVKPAYEKITSSHVATNGVPLKYPVVTETQNVPEQNVSFQMEESIFEFDCAPGELAEVYAAIMPHMAEVFKAMKGLNKK